MSQDRCRTFPTNEYRPAYGLEVHLLTLHCVLCRLQNGRLISIFSAVFQDPATLRTVSLSARRFSVLAALTVVLLPIASPASAQTLGPTLQEALASAAPLEQLEVVVTFEAEGPISSGQIAELQAIGVTGFWFRSLPIAGLLATPGQIEAIAALSSVRSIWLNDRLVLENRGPTAATGVDRLRADAGLRTAAGLPYSGRGIGVLVNDSGIDATHPDLKDNVVENVAGQTNLAAVSSLLPVTYVGGIPNTDHGGGHGTHVAGILGGTGAASGGKFEGVAPGADIIGYGSGAVVLVLDALGGFDYALTHQFEYNIRVVSNSFGESDDSGTDFQPDHPTNVATKKLADRGIIVVFSAGNSGPVSGTITGNYKKAPWVVTVAAGDNQGRLGSFSSRGRIGESGTFTGRDGTVYTWVDRPTITAPGTAVISANASTGSMHWSLHPEFVPYYAVATGTSMACPHVAGIIAMMLEADPTLDWRRVKDILESTATNMSGGAAWEAGAGYVNAHAAVVQTVLHRDGQAGLAETVNLRRSFNANVTLAPSQPAIPFDLAFSPAGTSQRLVFPVAEDTDLVSAAATIGENTAALVLTNPVGQQYESGVSIPAYQAGVTVTAPAVPGEWTLEVRGVGAWAGLRLDAFGLTNGIGVPGQVRGHVALLATDLEGLGDISGHPDESVIAYAVSRRLVDGDRARRFRPEDRLRRIEIAEYLVMGAGIRKALDEGGPEDLKESEAPFAAAVLSTGAALMDTDGLLDGVMRLREGAFQPKRKVTRERLAYSFVQSLALQEAARSHGERPVYDGNLELADWSAIAPELRGYVQLALDLGIMEAADSPQGPLYEPDDRVTRSEYAVYVSRFSDSFLSAPLPDLGFTAKGGFETRSPRRSVETVQDTPVDGGPELTQNYPNPFNPVTTIAFTLASETHALLEVFDLTGRRVGVLHDGVLPSGIHRVRFDGRGLATGRYLYRLTTPRGVLTRSMLLVK